MGWSVCVGLGLVGFGFLAAFLWQLNHDEPPIAAVLFVEFHYGMRRRATAGKEIQNDFAVVNYEWRITNDGFFSFPFLPFS